MANLTDHEARDLLSEISDALRSAGLGWILEQVDQEIATGRVITKSLSVPVDDFLEYEASPRRGRGEPSPGRRARFTSNEPYTPKEELSVLVRAVEQAVVVPIQMQNEIFVTEKASAVEFVSEVPDRLEHSFTPEELERLNLSATRLMAACRDLRELVEEDDNHAF